MKIIQKLILVALLFSFQSCNLFGDKEIDPVIDEDFYTEYYETGRSDFPYLAVNEEKTAFGFSKNLETVYVRQENGLEWLVEFNNDSSPKNMTVRKDDDVFQVVFSEIVDDKVNIGVFNPNEGPISYYYDVEFSGISKGIALAASSQQNLRSSKQILGVKDWLYEHRVGLSRLGTTLSALGCGMGVFAVNVGTAGLAAWVGPALTFTAAVSCTSFVFGIGSKVVGAFSETGEELLNAFGTALSIRGSLLCGVGFAAGGPGGALAGCAVGLLDAMLSVVGLTNGQRSRQEMAQARQQLISFLATGGLAGTWVTERLGGEAQNFVIKYYFQKDKGVIFIDAFTNNAGNQVWTFTSLEFRYTLLANNRFRIDGFDDFYQKIKYISDQGETSELTVPPTDWYTYANTYGKTAPISTGEVEFNLSDDKNTLTLGNDDSNYVFERQIYNDLIVGISKTE